MFDAHQPKFRIHQRVVALQDLVNDGSYPDAAADELLVASGSCGDVVRIGRHTETAAFIYVIDFGRRVLGCVEHELDAARPA